MSAPRAEHAPETVAFTFLDFGEGGAQRLALATWRHLDPARFKPVLVCARGRGSLIGEARAMGVEVICLGRLQRPWDVLTIPRLVRCFRDIAADVVHLPSYSRVAPYAMIAAALAGVPLTVAHEHCRPIEPGRSRALADRWLARLLPKTRHLAVSRAEGDALIAGGLAESAVAVLANGIEIEGYGGMERGPARAALGLPVAARIVLVPARLHPQKGHVDLLAAATIAADRLPDLILLCAGDGPLRSKLEALARCAGFGQRCRFLGHRDDMPRLLAAADLVVLPSRIEGMPLALLEAQAAGRCVLATAVGGVPEIIEDGRTGRLVPAGQPGELARSLVELLEDPELRDRLAEAGRAQARAQHGIGEHTRQLESIYTRWLGEPHDGARKVVSALLAGGLR